MDDYCVNGRISAANETHFIVSLDSDNSCKSCGLSNVCSDKKIEFSQDLYSGLVKIGQEVRVEYQKVIQTSLIIYLIPILFFFAGIVITQQLLNIQNELVIFASAMGSTGLAFVFISILNRTLSNTNYKVKITPISN